MDAAELPPQTLEVKARRTPEAISTHSVFDGEKWTEEPGTLKVTVKTRPVGSMDADLEDAASKWGRLLEEAQIPTRSQAVSRRLRGVSHKLEGVRYHRDNYERHEDSLIRRFESDYGPPAGAAVAEDDPRLIFEVEAFLYQVKSTLDMLARLLRDAGYRSMGESFGDRGDRVITALDSAPASAGATAKELQALIAAAQASWLDEAVSLRDQVAHRGALEELSCFVQQPYKGGRTAEVHYPQMPNSQRARDYLQRVERELRSFVTQFIGLTVKSISGKADRD